MGYCLCCYAAPDQVTAKPVLRPDESNTLVSTDSIKAVKNEESAKVDYERVDKAIGQLSDEDLAKVAERSRQAESDFAAGGLKATLIIVIVLIVILIIVLSLVF